MTTTPTLDQVEARLNQPGYIGTSEDVLVMHGDPSPTNGSGLYAARHFLEKHRDAAMGVLDKAIAEKRDLTASEDRAHTRHKSEVRKLEALVDAYGAEERSVIEAFRKLGPSNGPRFAGSGHDDGRRSIEGAFNRGELPDYAAERAMALINNGAPQERSLASQWATATGDPAYARAFAKIAGDPERGHLLWEPDEQRAYQAVAAVQANMRAMSQTDGAGGYMVPLVLDPSIMINSGGTTNSVVNVARIVSTVSESWQGVTSAGVTAEWLGEAAEAADGSPTLASVPIPVHKGSAYIPYSYEIGQDVPNFVQELQKVLLDGALSLAATAYTTGSGSGQPKGFVKALDGSASEVAPTTPETFAAADIYKLIEALPPRFRKNATWQANLTVLDLIDQFETTNGAKRFPQVGADPSILLRHPVIENSDMDGTWNTAATADNFILAVGDFQEFIIASRIGATLEFIPHVFGANGRPTGQRGAHLWFRTGSDVSHVNAFRLLNLATTA